MLAAYKKMFSELPKQYKYNSPLKCNDHPEVNDSKELIGKDTTKYQSMMCALQWAISLGHFDVLTAVMTMSRFRAAPREENLARLKRIYGYLPKIQAQSYSSPD